MVKTKVIIHLSPMGTQSQNIEEYIKDKDAQYLPHYVVGMKESIFDIYNFNSIDTYNNSNISGVGILGSYDREAIDIVICLPQQMVSNETLVDDSNQYFEQTRKKLIETISYIIQHSTITVDNVISHKEAYEAGMAQDRFYYIENWWNSKYSFYNMDYLRSDIQNYLNNKVIISDYRKYSDGTVNKVPMKDKKVSIDDNTTIYRVIIPNTTLTNELEQKIQGLGFNPSPLLFFTYLNDEDERDWYTAIQVKAFFNKEEAENLKNNLISFGYPNAEITTNNFVWDTDIDRCIRNENIDENISILLDI